MKPYGGAVTQGKDGALARPGGAPEAAAALAKLPGPARALRGVTIERIRHQPSAVSGDAPFRSSLTTPGDAVRMVQRRRPGVATLGWLAGALAGALPALYAASEGVSALWVLTLCFGSLWFLLPMLPALVNRTALEASRGMLTIKRGPLPRPTTTRLMVRASQLFVRDAARDGRVELCVVRAGSAPLALLTLDDRDTAEALERMLEEVLAIDDAPVIGEGTHRILERLAEGLDDGGNRGNR
jgi:hypothetical protein